MRPHHHGVADRDGATHYIGVGMNIYTGAIIHGFWFVPYMLVGCFLVVKYGKKNQFWSVISALVITIILAVGSLSFRWEMNMNTAYSNQSDLSKQMAFFMEMVPAIAAAFVVWAFKKRIRGEETDFV